MIVCRNENEIGPLSEGLGENEKLLSKKGGNGPNRDEVRVKFGFIST